MDDLITRGTAARLLGVSTTRVRQLEEDGRLSPSRTAEGIRLFRRGDVERLAQSRRVERESMQQERGR